jgi:hypothetical protein
LHLSLLAIQAPVEQAHTYTVEQANEWVQAELEEADMEMVPTTTILFTNTANCGADISTVAQGGCTYNLQDGTHVMVLSPTLPFTAWGHHILFHELAHTLGIMDECKAEAYAHQFEYDVELWSYPACEESPNS